MSEAFTITSKSIADQLDGWQITNHAPTPIRPANAVGEPLTKEDSVSAFVSDEETVEENRE